MFKPTTILTGFLGAGKTTFLNAVLSGRKSVRYAIIENEIGSESIDGELILKTEDNLIELNNGCLCCTLHDDLYQTLHQLHQRRDEFDELIIECTGIANPAAVALPFINHPSVKSDFPLQRVICLVDAELVEDQLKNTDETLRQISFSDIILINKTDQVDKHYLPVLKTILQKINPLALIIAGNKGQYSIDEIFRFQKNESLYKPVFRLDQNLFSSSSVKKHVHGDITAVAFRFSEPFDITWLYHKLYVFLKLQSKNVFRFKAIVNAHDLRQRIILQSVEDHLSIDDGEYWTDEDDRLSRFVFIGKDLQEYGLEKLLKQCIKEESDRTSPVRTTNA